MSDEQDDHIGTPLPKVATSRPALRRNANVVDPGGSGATADNLNARPLAAHSDLPHADLLRSLSQQQRKTITSLLDACTSLQHEGKHDLSDIVDRIGMTMMQSYLDRSRNGRR